MGIRGNKGRKGREEGKRRGQRKGKQDARTEIDNKKRSVPSIKMQMEVRANTVSEAEKEDR